MAHKGTCFCGAVEIEVEGSPEFGGSGEMLAE
jgi:hypothetical protein